MIENTGERILLEHETPFTIAKHFIAYKFCVPYVKERLVLDIGTGEGYGANFLVDFTTKLTAIDYDSRAIDYAKSKYNKPNINFQVMDATTLNFADNTFDVVCAFQVIEHIVDIHKFLKEVNRVIKEKGIFICSTPNKNAVSKNNDTPLNKYHVREYRYSEFKLLLQSYFKKIELYTVDLSLKGKLLRRLKKIGLFKFLPQRYNPVKRFYDTVTTDDFVVSKKGNIDYCQDFIAVALK